MLKPVLISACLLAAASTARATEDPCPDAQDQASLNACAGKAYKAADDELNKTYKEIQARLRDDEATSKLLVASQKAWIAFRDAECTFSTSAAAGGSIYPMLQDFCLAGLTSQRSEGLKPYLNCEEGDMSCPVPAP